MYCILTIVGAGETDMSVKAGEGAFSDRSFLVPTKKKNFRSYLIWKLYLVFYWKLYLVYFSRIYYYISSH